VVSRAAVAQLYAQRRRNAPQRTAAKGAASFFGRRLRIIIIAQEDRPPRRTR